MSIEKIKLTFLGTGTSHGVPMIGCSCSTCLSADPRDKRTNASIMLTVSEKNILIDCSRDFRQQALRHKLDRVDYVLITHPHFDHVAGIDDLRVYSEKQDAPVPLFGSQKHLNYLKSYIYHYLFDGTAQEGEVIAKLELIAVDSRFMLQEIMFEPLLVYHGEMEIFGYKFFNCAYISDVSYIPETTLSRLYDLELLILDSTRYRPHSTHFNLKQALDIVSELKPRQTYLTHICHDILHRELEALLQDPQSEYYTPFPVNIAYDGLRLPV